MTAPLMLFEKVPLISAAKIGTFFDDALIGHHYGDLSRSRVRCAKMDQTLYLVGAHPWQEITACYISDKKTEAFSPLVRTDTDGVTRQYVQLVQPPAEDNAVVMVAGKGKLSKVSGKLLENPDEIIEDIAALCGRSLNFPLFREACNRKGLRVAGSVYEARSLRSYVAEIIESCGALWLGSNAVFYPGEALGYALPFPALDGVTQGLSMADVAGKLGVWYGWNHGKERNGGYIEVEAVGCQYDNLGLYYAKWLRLPRDAEALARRLLAHRAGEFVKVKATAPGIVRAGEVIELQNETFNGAMLITAAQPSEVQTDVEGEITISSFSNIKVTQFSTENQADRSQRVDVLLDLIKSEATVTIFDANNRPMADVLVTYDSSITKKTDKNGIVVFSVSSGNHTLVLQGPGIDNNEPYPLFIP